MAAAYYRSLYFSLDCPEDLEVLGLLLALPRWRRPSAIKGALKQCLPTLLDGPPLSPDEVRTTVRNAPGRRRQRAPRQSGSGSPVARVEYALARAASEPAETILPAEPTLDVQTAERLLETKLDDLMKSRWIG